MSRFVAVESWHEGTCDALRWAWSGIHTMILATGDDEDDVRERAQKRCGHGNIAVHDFVEGNPVRDLAGEQVDKARIAELEGGFLGNLVPWDLDVNPNARVLGGTTTILGMEHHVVAVQVEGGLEGNTYQRAVCDPCDRLKDIGHLNDSWLEPVSIPGHEGDWVVVIYPFWRG